MHAADSPRFERSREDVDLARYLDRVCSVFGATFVTASVLKWHFEAPPRLNRMHDP
jgi:hypothetical protein